MPRTSKGKSSLSKTPSSTKSRYSRRRPSSAHQRTSTSSKPTSAEKTINKKQMTPRTKIAEPIEVTRKDRLRKEFDKGFDRKVEVKFENVETGFNRTADFEEMFKRYVSDRDAEREKVEEKEKKEIDVKFDFEIIDDDADNSDAQYYYYSVTEDEDEEEEDSANKSALANTSTILKTLGVPPIPEEEENENVTSVPPSESFDQDIFFDDIAGEGENDDGYDDDGGSAIGGFELVEEPYSSPLPTSPAVALDEVVEPVITPRKETRKARVKGVDASREGRGRRATLKLINEAERMHAFEHDEEEEDGLKKRSGRTRRPPLAFWKNERVIYQRNESGDGAILPVLKYIASPTTKTPEPRSRIPRKRRKTDKKISKDKKRRKIIVESESDGYLSEETESGSIQKEGSIFDYSQEKDKSAIFMKATKHLNLVKLNTQLVDGFPKLKEAQKPEACTVFEREGFSTGILIVPPDSYFHEKAKAHMVFYMLSGERNTLETKIHNNEPALASSGTSIDVPFRNSYILRNKSKKVPIKLHFTIVRPEEEEEEEV